VNIFCHLNKKTIALRFVRFAFCLSTLLCSGYFSIMAAPPGNRHFVKTTDGIVVFQLQLIKDNIIQVLASPFEKVGPTNSLVTQYTGSASIKWELQDSKDQIVLKTNRLVANVRVRSGAVLFSDNTGIPILQEDNPKAFDAEQGADTTVTCHGNMIYINMKPMPRRSK
jgi:hypothetical protein